MSVSCQEIQVWKMCTMNWKICRHPDSALHLELILFQNALQLSPTTPEGRVGGSVCVCL